MPGNVPYPFVFVGEQLKQDVLIHKDYRNGETQVTVHVWHDNHKKRGTLSTMASNIETAVKEKYGYRVIEANFQMLPNSSTGADLLHGIVEFNIKY